MHTTTVLGIEIPSASPLFLAIVGTHVLLGLGAVIAGAMAMLSEKGTPRHIASGRSYFWCLTALVGAASALALMRWAEDYHLFLLGALAFVAATVGRSVAKRKTMGWPRVHVIGMGSSYILMLTAFYVDNGKSLPVWRDLPSIAYWIVPAAVGLPILLSAILFHPVVKKYRRSL